MNALNIRAVGNSSTTPRVTESDLVETCKRYIKDLEVSIINEDDLGTIQILRLLHVFLFAMSDH